MKKKIFVMYGTQPFHFKRLDNYLNQINLDEFDVKVQVGKFGDLKKGIDTFEKDTHESIIESINKADIIISHGGVGSIFDALLNDKNPIVLPRLQKFNEHVDDHQMEIVEKLYSMNLIQISQEDFTKDINYLTKNVFSKYKSNFNLPMEVMNEFNENDKRK
jgi:beta-1,4-N-acetylglucosaminyltransferase